MAVERVGDAQFDLNLFDPDESVDMFYGKYIHTFPIRGSEKGKSFIYRRIDPGTLLELIDTALLTSSEDINESQESDELQSQPVEQVEQVEISPLSKLKAARVQIYHRLEVLQKCIVKPTFNNLEQIKKIPLDWQITLYNKIMHGTLGGETATVDRFLRTS